MKKQPCEKCGTRHRPSRHHNLPKCFYHGRGDITWLCVYCHRKLEEQIFIEEKLACKDNKVRRFNLGSDKYHKILCKFLTDYPVEYTYSLIGKEFL